MTEKAVNETQNEARKERFERFEFRMTINGNIICQRYFKIDDFKNESKNSIELVEAIDKCVSMIDHDLVQKTQIYLENSSPMVFTNVDEMNAKIESGLLKLDVPSYIICDGDDKAYVWNGTNVEPYDKFFNRVDYIAPEEQQECTLCFAFYDNGHEVISKIWDGNVYPRFIRTNIDLSNSKNKYASDDVYAPVENWVMKEIISSQEDLIPKLINVIYETCSGHEKSYYTTSDTYGDKKYSFDVYGQNLRYMRSFEKACKKKTDEYFKRA